MPLFHCPICDREFTPGEAMPFCSARCKLIDCARWLGEAYGLPIEDNVTDTESGKRAFERSIAEESPES